MPVPPKPSPACLDEPVVAAPQRGQEEHPVVSLPGVDVGAGEPVHHSVIGCDDLVIVQVLTAQRCILGGDLLAGELVLATSINEREKLI